MEILFTIGLLIILISIIVLAIWSIIDLSNKSQKLWARIYDMEERVDKAETEEKLLELWEELKVLSKDSPHSTYGSHLSVMSAVLKTKYKYIKNNHDSRNS